MKEKSDIDILIPVFNEDEIIVKTIKNIQSAIKYNYKILICYDYDEDPTLKIIKENLHKDSVTIYFCDTKKVFTTRKKRFLWQKKMYDKKYCEKKFLGQ